jgi:Flp pilus assembly protein TadG
MHLFHRPDVRCTRFAALYIEKVWRWLPSGRRGIAATEFALIAVPMTLMLAAAFDFGLALWQRMQMETALTAAAGYALAFPTQTGAICDIITQSLPPGLTKPTANVALAAPECPANLSQPATRECSATCTQGPGGVFVTLSVSSSYAPLYFSAITTNSANYVVRVQ